MKRILQKTLLAIACLLCSIVASAHDFEVDGIYYNFISETYKTVEVVKSSKIEYTGNVVIPETVTYKGTTYSVTSIGSWAFYECDGLTSITIPNSVTSIGICAFEDCTGLTSVTIPESVTSIGDCTFYGCTGLTSVIIPNSVTWIGREAFVGCESLRKVINCSNFTLTYFSEDFGYVSCYAKFIINAPNGYIEGDYVWYENEGTNILAAYLGNATELSLPDNYGGNYRIGFAAFCYCTGLTSVTIPESVTSIGSRAFSYCYGLTSILVAEGNSVYDSRENCNAIIETATNMLIGGCVNTIIPNSVTSIGDDAFYGCDGLTSITIPNSVTSIGDYAFTGCTGLTSVIIPNSVTSIGYKAFYECTGLTSITIGNSVTSIGESAFENCTGLTSIIIPNSVTSIGVWAFAGCESLKKVINCSNFTLNYHSTDYGCVAYYANLIINAPNGYIEGDYVWYENEGTNILAAYLGNATELSLPDNYGENYRIGGSAFDGCTGLTSITIPNGVTSIGDNAFNGCNRIKDVYAYPTQPPTIYANTFTYYVNDNATLHTIIGCKKDYEEALYWNYFYNIKQDLSAGIEGVKAEEAFSVAVVGGTLAIAGAADDAVVNIYNTNGALLHNTTVAGAADIALPNGIYLVQVNGVTQKVVL